MERSESFKCSGKVCRSMAGGATADCVAVCCCPCAVVNILTLTFVKVPYKMGRKCLQKMKKKRKEEKEMIGWRESVEIISRKSWEIEEMSDKVWEELYELGHLGFGRVSFTRDIYSSSLDKSI